MRPGISKTRSSSLRLTGKQSSAFYGLFLLAILLPWQAYGQDLSTIRASLEPLSFSTYSQPLRFYTLCRAAPDVKGHAYPFKGTKLVIDSSKPTLPVPEGYLAWKDIDAAYGLFRLNMDEDQELWFWRAFYEGGYEHRLYATAYDSKTARPLQTLEVAYCYAYESNAVDLQAWLVDINQDGEPELISHEVATGYEGPDNQLYGKHRLFVHNWNQEKWLVNEIPDGELKHSLLQQFPLEPYERLAPSLREQLIPLIEKP